MTPEKILEIARRYTSPEEESSILIDEDGNPTGETLNLMMWNFCEEELIAFVQSVIEAERESSDEPVAWLTLGKDIGSDRDIVTFRRSHIIPSTPLYTRQVPARKPLSDEEIEKEFDRRCELDCCPDFSEAVRWAEKAHGIGEEE